MHWQTVVDVDSLAAARGARALVIVDCRFDLRDADAGERAWRAGHIPGAVYAHLNRDLADLHKQGRGRHPLPEASAFCQALARWGITPASQVVAYDADNGSMAAARLWWLLRRLGHRDVAVLDGGFAAWVVAGYPIDDKIPPPAPGHYSARFDVRAIATTAVVAARMAGGGLLVDARAPERFRGEVEPVDAVAGHIPGAVNRPFSSNLTAAGRFKSPAQLAQEFTQLLGTIPASEVVLMCGSGVTACHNALMMEHAGLPGARVYAGSWSEWSSDPARPVAKG